MVELVMTEVVVEVVMMEMVMMKVVVEVVMMEVSIVMNATGTLFVMLY
jgi:hypothetical protein